MNPQTPPSRFWLALPFLAFGVGVLLCRDAWAALLIYHALLLIPLIRFRDRWTFRAIGRGFHTGWFLAHLAAVGAGFWLLVQIGAARGFSGERLDALLAGTGLESGRRLGFALYFCLVNPVFEEVFWRQLFARPGAQFTIEDALFGAFHALILAPFLSPPFVAGGVVLLTLVAWFWRWLRFRLGGLALPVAGHCLGDAMFSAIVAVLAAR